jgi:deoxyadenosine/deoxycytidine kinase
MTPAQIEIKGAVGSGKSALAYAIKHMLESHGLACEITGCEEEEPAMMQECWPTYIERLALQAQDEPIAIKTIQVVP